jgi:pimeloyl-ACP methyl ester carboxylesterase
LHHIAAFRRAARSDGWRLRLDVLRQRRRSWYVFAFQIPWLPELVLRRLNRRLLATRDRSRFHFADSLPDDSVNGLELYRANIFHREPLSGDASTDIPVLLVVPNRDKYVGAALTADLGRFVENLTRVEIDAGHWLPRSHPDELAAAIEQFVTAHPVD